jgi:hypothetical protein
LMARACLLHYSVTSASTGRVNVTGFSTGVREGFWTHRE